MAQGQTNSLDFFLTAAGNVSNGTVFDFSVVAIGLPQQVAGVGFVFETDGGGVDVHSGYHYMK